MSLTFHIRAATKADARQAAARKFDAADELFPHCAPARAAAEAAVTAYIDLLREPTEGETVVVNVSGYLSPAGEAGNLGVGVSLEAPAG